MAKKPSGQVQSIPEIYHGLTQDPTLATATIVEDHNFLFYVFASPQEMHLVSKAVHKQWNGIAEFQNMGDQTILAYHEQLFGCNPPKDQIIEITGVWVWQKIGSQAVDRRPSNKVPVINDRKSTIGLSEYRMGEVTDNTSLKTPQAKTCHKLFVEALEAKGKGEGADRVIIEADLRQYVIDHAGELRTRQDPWRIFQYYRPNLIEAKMLRRQ